MTAESSRAGGGKTPSAEDLALIEAFLYGEPDATRRVSDWVIAVVKHRAWRLRQTEDLSQEVLLELVRVLGAGRFQGRSTLKTFVQKVAKSTCLNAVRRERRATVLSLEETLEPQARPGDGPERELDGREVARLCYAVLSRLPAPCRSLLQRVLMDEPSYEDLAVELGVAVGTVKSRVSRCRERANSLRRRLLRAPAVWRGGSTS